MSGGFGGLLCYLTFQSMTFDSGDNTAHPEIHSIAEQLLCLVGVADHVGETDRCEAVLALCLQVLDSADGAVLLGTQRGEVGLGVATSVGISEFLMSECALGREALRTALVGVDPVHQWLNPADVPYDEYVERALNMGFHHECVLPLQHRGHVLGAVVALGRHELGPSPDRVSLVGTLASVAAAVLHAGRTTHMSVELAGQLQSALHSRVSIEQAKGILATRAGTGIDAAFGVLRNRARAERRPLADVAADVVRSL